MRDAEFDHFTRAHEEDLFVLKRTEKAKRKTHGRGGEAHGVGADRGGGAHFLGHRKGGLEEMVEHDAEPVAFARDLFGLLHLADDLRFAEHHGVKPGGDSEGVLSGFFLIERIDVRFEFVQLNVLALGQIAQDARAGGFGVFGREIDFRTVAGRQNGGFVHASLTGGRKAFAQVSDGRGNFRVAERNALAHFHRSRRVIET